jgi:hypothetical protein
MSDRKGRICIVLSLVSLCTGILMMMEKMGRNDKPNHWHITHYHPDNLNNHVTTSNTFFLHFLAPLSAFPLQSMPPKTRASQWNKSQAEHPPAASTQLVAITMDSSEPQVMIQTNKPTTKHTHAKDTTTLTLMLSLQRRKPKILPLNMIQLLRQR